MDISALNSLSKTLSNIEIYQPELPDYEDTVCGKMDRLNSTQESQLNELEKIKYENIKLNAQIDTLNKLTDKQSDDINTLKIDLATTQKHLDSLKKQYEDSNKHSFITGIANCQYQSNNFFKKFFAPIFALPGPYYIEINIFATRKQSLHDADLIFIFN